MSELEAASKLRIQEAQALALVELEIERSKHLMKKELEQMDEENLRRWCVEQAVTSAKAAAHSLSGTSESIIRYGESVMDYAEKILHFVKNSK